ncbi:hypothetical protein [Streptomyces litmocidini]|uniref:Lipoprotein n=1 Tax=Streptomyces litmocidini TaxID=67318 RepID=A0ABW7U8Q7_9ACTN
MNAEDAAYGVAGRPAPLRAVPDERGDDGGALGVGDPGRPRLFGPLVVVHDQGAHPAPVRRTFLVREAADAAAGVTADGGHHPVHARRRFTRHGGLGPRHRPRTPGLGHRDSMYARRTTLLLLVALLTTGCVAVPHGSAPGPPARPGGLAPAADRPPAPLPAWPAPTEPAPREALTTTDPRPARPPARKAAVPAAEEPAARRPGTRGTAPHRPHTTADRPGKPAHRSSGTRTAPRSSHRNRPAPVRPRPRTDARPPEMRRLCHQAEDIQAPMGAADLCRSLYGR